MHMICALLQMVRASKSTGYQESQGDTYSLPKVPAGSPRFSFPREAIPLVSIGLMNKISGLEEKQGFLEEDASFTFLMPPQ